MRRMTIVAATAVLAIAVSGCGSSSQIAEPGVKTVEIKLTDAGCDPAHVEVPAGPTSFEITNDGADAVSEFEVLDGGKVLGERENLTPGLSGDFSITLKPGTYVTSCPGGTTADKGELVVTGAASPETTEPRKSAAAQQAVSAYREYVESEATKLVAATTAFANAVKNGDVATAKRLFPGARSHYESIEPIAESFGDLDPEIDARANDVAAAAKFEGFHRIEQQMWQQGNVDGMVPVATNLLTDVKELQSRIPGIALEPAQVANGAVELLNEVATSKITGEEDRYSHTDLWDFEANLEGAKQAFVALRPMIRTKDPALVNQLETRFAATEKVLAGYKEGDGYVLYTTLAQADTRSMAKQVDALADVLSKVAPLVIAG